MPNPKGLDEGEGTMNDEAKGQAEDPTDTSSSNEDERDERRSARESRVYEEKKAVNLGPSGR